MYCSATSPDSIVGGRADLPCLETCAFNECSVVVQNKARVHWTIHVIESSRESRNMNPLRMRLSEGYAIDVGKAKIILSREIPCFFDAPRRYSGRSYFGSMGTAGAMLVSFGKRMG